MANEDLKRYVDDARQSGHNDTDISAALEKAGWEKAEIDAAFGIQKKAEDTPRMPVLPPDKNKKGTAPAEIQAMPNEPISGKQDNKKDNTTNSLAIIALIFAFVFPLLGLILGIIAKNQIKHTKQSGRGIATAAIIISGISVVIFIFLVFISVIAYLGVLNPSGYLPVRCAASYGLECNIPEISSSEIIIPIRNTIGSPILIKETESGLCEGESFVSLGRGEEFFPLGETTVNNNQEALLRLTGCNNGNPGKKASDDIKVTYLNQESLLEYSSILEISGRVG